MKKKLVCVLACRNQGSRLYGKPLQNLDIKKKIRVIDFIIQRIKKIKSISSTVLAISNTKDNDEYKNVAKKYSLKYIKGDKTDVLKRLILGANKSNATDIFRITSESPYVYNNIKLIKKSWNIHKKNNLDFSYLDNKIIDGCGFEIISLKALKLSHKLGKKKHRSELCSLFIRENMEKFKTRKLKCPDYLLRQDLRLTIDYPEDLIICRDVYKNCKNYNLKNIVNYLDKTKSLKIMGKKIIQSEK